MRGPRELVGRYAPRVRSGVLTAGAVVGSLCLLATIVAPVLGIRPLIFLSGSMSPAIPAGSLALARTVAADDLQVGDIVTVPTRDTYVTHRIVEVSHAPGKATLLLRGDGNEVTDATAYEVTSAPVTFFAVPRLGSVVAWFSHAPGVYVLAAWVALVVGSLRRPPRGVPASVAPGAPRPPVRRPKPALAISRLVARTRRAQLLMGGRWVWVPIVATAVVAPVVALPPALAVWGDVVHVTGTEARKSTPTAPLAWCHEAGEGRVSVRWTGVTGATGYEVTYGTAQEGSVVRDVPSSTTSIGLRRPEGTITVRATYGTRAWQSPSSNTVTYETSGVGSCS